MARAEVLHFKVLTPLTTVLDGPAATVIAPLPDGWIGILPGHSAFQSRLLRGSVVFEADGQRRIIATIGGVISVAADTITVLTGAAALDQDLDALEHDIGEEAVRLREMEQEAEKHFDRVYRALARTFNGRKRFA
jgi:F0F1-type ATP synthase epsilon subunit